MSAHSTIRYGSHGDDVAAWQRILGVDPDGDFGPKTLAATKKWQAAHGLDPDGVVGPKTWTEASHPGDGGGGGNGGGHEDPKPPSGDVVYPLHHPCSGSFRDSPRFFGSPRDSGRLHAGVDLYAAYLSPIRAIADGHVIQPPYSFYDGTNALEVHHPGVGTVRYGEISSSKVVHWSSGAEVKCGQLIAYVGLLDSLQMSMIHFELYSGKASGPLTDYDNWPYQRRRDLVNPSSLVDRLYAATFG
jgi:murein DD-endopeptidase MepM/ murein hydrolase activator NlpD